MRSCKAAHSQAHIARKIGVDPHEKASQKRKEASDKPRKMTPDLVDLIEEKLTREQWSPDQISGRLAKDGVAFISHERVYQHVWKDKKDALHLHLRHSDKKYNKRKGKNSVRGDGPMDGPYFLAYVEQILAPTLKKGQIVLNRFLT
jgi:IS30 family transposase